VRQNVIINWNHVPFCCLRYTISIRLTGCAPSRTVSEKPSIPDRGHSTIRKKSAIRAKIRKKRKKHPVNKKVGIKPIRKPSGHFWQGHARGPAHTFTQTTRMSQAPAPAPIQPQVTRCYLRFLYKSLLVPGPKRSALCDFIAERTLAPSRCSGTRSLSATAATCSIMILFFSSIISCLVMIIANWDVLCLSDRMKYSVDVSNRYNYIETDQDKIIESDQSIIIETDQNSRRWCSPT